MIGFDRPLRPHWIYESLLLAEPGQKMSELNIPFETIARELTGKEGKRKVRTVLFRCFLRDETNATRVKEQIILKNISKEKGLEFMKPIYLFYLIGKTETLVKISNHLFRLYDLGDEINQDFLKSKMIDEFGERDVVGRSLRSFIHTLEYFGIVERKEYKLIMKNKIIIDEEQLMIMLHVYAHDVLMSPQVSLNHLPIYLRYFSHPDIKTIAQKYNGTCWDFQHRMNDDYLIVHEMKNSLS